MKVICPSTYRSRECNVQSLNHEQLIKYSCDQCEYHQYHSVQKQLEERNRELTSLNKELSSVKGKCEDLLEENNKLREGMHEILDSIKEQDGRSDVLVSCPVLEQLLIILDARHFYGDYKPAMGLKSQMEKLDGVN